MKRLLATAALVPLALTALAVPAEAGTRGLCHKVFSAKRVSPFAPAPYVLPGDTADGTLINKYSIGEGESAVVTSCVFYDVDRDRRLDAWEPTSGTTARASLPDDGDGELGFGIYAYSFRVPRQAPANGRLCWRESIKVTGADGSVSRSTTSTACFLRSATSD